MTGRRLRVALVAVAMCGAAAASLRGQANVEEQAHRQLESGREFYRAGRYAEALKDFQTVAEGYATSTVADDAMLAIAQYQLEIQRDPISARSTAAPGVGHGTTMAITLPVETRPVGRHER